MSLEKSALGDFEEDHAVIAVRKMDLLLKRFCTPIASKRRPLATEFLHTFTQTLKEHILKRTRSFAVDGAVKERRALEYAVGTIFPNVVLIVRDAAHALRIAIKYPHPS